MALGSHQVPSSDQKKRLFKFLIRIRESSNVLVGPGEIDLVKPYEIHTEITVGERTVAVIIRSQKGGEFNQGRYVPEENRYYESLGPRQTPCEMLPKY